MSLKVKELVEILQKKEQDSEVEFIVVTTSGALVCMDVQAKAGEIIKVLKFFKSV